MLWNSKKADQYINNGNVTRIAGEPGAEKYSNDESIGYWAALYNRLIWNLDSAVRIVENPRIYSERKCTL